MDSLYYIDSFEVADFRGEGHVIASLGDVNFVIGRNGTGKTTLINLISAALNFQIQQLGRIEFRSIRLSLRSTIDRADTCAFSILRTEEESAIFIEVRFENWPNAGREAVKIPVIREQAIRGSIRTSDTNGQLARWINSPAAYRSEIGLIKEQIARVILFRTISISRWSADDTVEENRTMSDVDKKIQRQVIDVASILNGMDRKFTELLQAYQVEFFLSLADRSMLEPYASAATINAQHDAEKLAEVFANLRIPPNKYEGLLKTHREEVGRALGMMESGEPMDMKELAAYLDGVRLHSFVDKWDDLTETKGQIFSAKTIFADVINDMYHDKEFWFSPDNRAQFARKGKKVDIQSLASGEKQLFIFLAEAFIQQNGPAVFIADEPEISLHIDWQAALVDKLKLINPNAQLILATHSPDIVSHYRDNVVSLG